MNPPLRSPGAGYDQVKVDDCSQRGIRVSHTPNAVDDATADLAMWLILGCLRNFPAHMAVLRAGAWQDHSTLPIGHDPQDKILGILGMGGIGRNLAAKARPFGMKIRYHNRSPLSPELANGAEYVDFETLLRESDILSLNLPLNVSFLVAGIILFYAQAIPPPPYSARPRRSSLTEVQLRARLTSTPPRFSPRLIIPSLPRNSP